MTKKKRIGANEERIGPLSDERRKDILEINLRGGLQYIVEQVRVGHQLLNRQDARPHRAGQAAQHRRRGDRMKGGRCPSLAHCSPEPKRCHVRSWRKET